MLDEILTNINLAGKLRGTFVTDNDGKVVAQQMLAAEDSELPQTLATSIVGMLGTLQANIPMPKAVDYDFDAGKVFIRNFDWGVVVMLGSHQVNLPLLNLLLDIALPKITRMMNTDEFRSKRKKPL